MHLNGGLALAAYRPLRREGMDNRQGSQIFTATGTGSGRRFRSRTAISHSTSQFNSWRSAAA